MALEVVLLSRENRAWHQEEMEGTPDSFSPALLVQTEASLLREKAEAAMKGAAASQARAAELDRDAEEKLQGAGKATKALQQEVASLKAELEELRAAKVGLGGGLAVGRGEGHAQPLTRASGGQVPRPVFSLPSGQEVLQQLGLDKLREERLQLKVPPRRLSLPQDVVPVCFRARRVKPSDQAESSLALWDSLP